MLGMYSSPPCQGLLGSSPTQRNSLPLSLGTGAERSQTCGVPLFKASPSRRALNSLLLVSSDALTSLVCYIHKRCSHYLEIGTQFPDSENVHCNLEIAQIPRYARNIYYVVSYMLPLLFFCRRLHFAYRLLNQPQIKATQEAISIFRFSFCPCGRKWAGS